MLGWRIWVQQGQWRSTLREGCERAFVFLKCCCFLDVFSNHVMQVHQCLGPSMLPTFNISGDILLMELFSAKFEKIKRGDVVMARSPINAKLMVCKRVMGLEGDNVEVVPPSGHGRYSKIVVPKGHVWLQGDNMHVSKDSRDYGPIPYALIQGRVFFRIWPPRGFGPVERHE